ncbi:MAG: nuclear transport factor 2 family protein [Anaerolineales bacterium]|nr:nuclear transport factor 2 family protein [Anaerolineales bacterium]
MTRQQLIETLQIWMNAWNEHDLDEVMMLFHDEAIFENWDGKITRGKANIRRLWTPWFANHGDFHFALEDIVVDETAQKALLRWRCTWPSPEKTTRGEPEVRQGLDVLHFAEGLITHKLTYSKTVVLVNGRRHLLP